MGVLETFELALTLAFFLLAVVEEEPVEPDISRRCFFIGDLMFCVAAFFGLNREFSTS